jgi:hypothetical protein
MKAALVGCLTTAERLHVLKTDAPVWTGHDRPGPAGGGTHLPRLRRLTAHIRY